MSVSKGERSNRNKSFLSLAYHLNVSIIHVRIYSSLCCVNSVNYLIPMQSGPEVIKLFSCSNQLIIKSILLISVNNNC